MSDQQTEKKAFAPGMTMPVIAGEEYTLKDTKGEALVIEGRDDPLTIEFAQAFSAYLDVRAVYPAESDICKGAWQACLDAFNALPTRIHDKLTLAGIVIPAQRPL